MPGTIRKYGSIGRIDETEQNVSIGLTVVQQRRADHGRKHLHWG